MEELSVDGITLKKAATIIASAGGQIDAMMKILTEKLIYALENEKEKIRAENRDDDTQESVGSWMIKSYLEDISLLKGKSDKPYAHVAVQIVLNDEKEAEIRGWEPSLYVIYGLGEDKFNLKDFRISSAKDDKWDLDGNTIWRWKKEGEKGWAFVLPLVKLNSGETLDKEIVEPVKKLLEGKVASNAFPSESVAFQFNEDDNGLSILTGSRKGQT